MTSAIGKWVLALALLGAAFFSGKYVRGRDDADADVADSIKRDQADEVRVRTIDGLTISGDIHYTTEITYQRAVQAQNVKEQANAIAANPDLAACHLPTDLVRLRGEQVEASRQASATPGP
jgi:hypothetical protein